MSMTLESPRLCSTYPLALTSFKNMLPDTTPYKQAALDSTCQVKDIYGHKVTHRHFAGYRSSPASILEAMIWRLPHNLVPSSFHELIYDVSIPNEDNPRFRFEYTAIRSTGTCPVMMFADLDVFVGLLLIMDKKRANRGGVVEFDTRDVLSLTNPRVTKNRRSRYQAINESLLRILNTKFDLISLADGNERSKFDWVKYHHSKGVSCSLMEFCVAPNLDLLHQLLKSVFTREGSWNIVSGSQRHSLNLDYGIPFDDEQAPRETLSMERKINRIYRSYMQKD
ncbi:hypothetical protein [Vibrio pomeroyi]|uniref:hypothetical protein n=1 Tax=Vibrio pomeroyi TaxID=198832 RepID=UPI0021C48A35|nr:hypothetical protein [Vibrio pomeroyi]